MTDPLRKSIETIAPYLNDPKNILEIGSKREKGQNEVADLRDLFSNSEYVGLDMRKGRGVDVVANAEKLPFKKNRFDLILCLETLEHAKKPWVIADEIMRVLKDNGVAIVSSQQNFPLHMHPSDYFRYTPYGLGSLFDEMKQKLVYTISPPFDNEVKLNPTHVILVAWNGKAKLKDKLVESLKENKSYISGHKPYRHRLKDGLKHVKRGISELDFQLDLEFFEL